MRASAAIEVEGPTVEVEQVWYDPSRWASWVDGFAHVSRLDDDWPQAGARRVWNSPPGGRGLVSETVVEYRVRAGQMLRVEDARFVGFQSVTFEAAPAGTRVRIELDLAPKGRMPPGRRLWVQRKLGESLRRTLTRFSYEVAADRRE